MTGRNDQREAFQKMLADSDQSQSWEIVLVYALDRFGRNSIEVAINKQRLKKNGKILISATQRTSTNIDGSQNLDGIILENVMIGISEYYSAELSQKVRRGQIENLKKGKWLGGQILYGYKAENKRLVIDEEKAKIVIYIFEQYFAGKIVPDIIKDLTEKGIYHLGKPFKKCVLYYILSYAEQTEIENQLTKEKIIDYLKTGIKKKPQIMLNLLINKIILYDDKIEIHYNYTENHDPDGNDRDFVLYAALIQDIKKQTKPNLIVQLSLSWLPLADSNCRHCG